jgi:RNA polymerase sigma factor (sigma-70 family)
MKETSPVVEATELLRHAAWLRRLAHALASDGAAADDAVQDTYLAALGRPPSADRPVRPWLSAVVRNFLRRQHRARTRGERRDRAAAGDEEMVSDPEELLARHQALRVVAELVAELDEPFRATILVCYGEGLEPSEAARRLGVPAGTVRWRLKRGLDLVRERLDARHGGDRRKWVVLLVPAGWRRGPRAGRWLMKAALLTGGVAAIVLTVALGQRPLSKERPKPSGAATAGRLVRLSPVRLAVAPTPPDGVVIAGVVREGSGRGLGGASVALVVRRPIRNASLSDLGSVAATAVTDAAGRFRLMAAGGPCSLTVTAPGFEPAHEPNLRPEGVPLAVVLAPGGETLGGRVTEKSGSPVAGARVVALEDRGFHDADLSRAFVAVTDADGRYRLGLSKGSHLLLARADGYGQVSRVVQLYAQGAEDFQLGPAGEVTGRVLDESGRPVPSAAVALEPIRGGGTAADGTAGAAGDFVVSHLAAGSYRLVARAGTLYAAAPPTVEVRESFRSEGVTVTVSRGATIEGRAMDAAGAPVPGAELDLVAAGGGWRRAPEWVSDAEGRFRIDGIAPGRYSVRVDERSPGELDGEVTADVSRGHAVVSLVLRPGLTVRGQVLDALGRPASQANVLAWNFALADGARARSLRAVADLAGRFTLRRLRPGKLDLAAEDPRFGAVGKRTPVELGPPAPAEVVLRLGPGVLVQGTVLWSDGAPAASVLVRGFTGGGGFTFATRRARTAADGSFTLERAPSFDLRILATADEGPVDIWQRPLGPDCLLVPIRGGVAPPPLVLTLARVR